MIKKIGTNKWYLYSKDGKKILGRHSSKASARRQELAIQIHKRSKTLKKNMLSLANYINKLLFTTKRGKIRSDSKKQHALLHHLKEPHTHLEHGYKRESKEYLRR